jgi:hypothetical protein
MQAPTKHLRHRLLVVFRLLVVLRACQPDFFVWLLLLRPIPATHKRAVACDCIILFAVKFTRRRHERSAESLEGKRCVSQDTGEISLCMGCYGEDAIHKRHEGDAIEWEHQPLVVPGTIAIRTEYIPSPCIKHNQAIHDCICNL